MARARTGEMKILVVDDDENMVKIIQLMLKRYGECDVANNGRKGVNQFLAGLKSDRPYDVVCLDLRMPSLNGIEALKFMREMEEELGIEKENQTPVIIVSSEEENAVVQNAAASGSTAYVFKVTLKEDLPQKLEELGFPPPREFKKLSSPDKKQETW